MLCFLDMRKLDKIAKSVPCQPLGYGAARTLTWAHHRTSVYGPNVGCDPNVGAPNVGLTHSRHGHYHEGLAADDPAADPLRTAGRLTNS